MKKLVALLLVMITAMTLLVACGCSVDKKIKTAIGDSDDGVKTGKYSLIKITQGEDTLKEGDEGFDYIKGMTLEIMDGGKFTLTFDEQKTEGTYKADGSKLSFTADGETIKGKLSGKKITLKDDSSEMVFELK